MHSPTAQASRRTAALLALALATTGLAAAPAASAATSRVVVMSLTGDVAGAARAVSAAGGRVLNSLALIGGVSANLPAGTVLAPSFRVVPDSGLRVAGKVDSSDATTLASGVRGTLGLGPAANEGQGVTVAVVDTGVTEVGDLQGRVTHVNVTAGADGDGYGHGTFVAGLVAGNGADSNGTYAGIAPAARILDVRVADATGNTSLIKVLTGLQDVAAHPEVSVVNLSLSSGSPLPYQIDPLTVALEALWRRGVTVVVPAGNDGPAEGTITSPGSDPVLLTTGGLDMAGTAARADDTVASWSGRGPAPQGVQKPDLVAPGAHVVSLRDPGSVIDTAYAGSRVDGTNGSSPAYFKGSGTSFSTAVTSGAVAALLARRPGLTPDQVKELLTDTAYKANGLENRNAAGAGGLDLAAAYDAKVNKDSSDSGADGRALPGDPAVWAAFLNALLSGDETAAASSWSQLSPAARNWAASSWSAGNWAARNWAARNWSGSTWSAGNWAARNWSGSTWSAGNWAARNWSGSTWSAGNWAAGNWAEYEWAAGNWAAGNWAAGNWAARNWSGTWQ